MRRDGRELVRVLGWSFPAPEVRHSPLASAPAVAPAAVPTVGLLHCHLGTTTGTHAPVVRAELDAVAVDAWLLGHVHAPSLAGAGRPVGYLGSLAGLDPTEIGPHGPWEIQVAPAGLRVRQLPLAPLWWDVVDVAVDGLVDGAGVEDAIVAAVQRFRDQLVARGTAARAAGVVVRLVGRNAVGASLYDPAVAERACALRTPPDRAPVVFVHDVRVEVVPAHDLAALGRGADPGGALANLLAALADDEADARRLQDVLRERIDALVARPYWRRLGRALPDDAALRALLQRGGTRALEILLASRRAPREPA